MNEEYTGVIVNDVKKGFGKLVSPKVVEEGEFDG